MDTLPELSIAVRINGNPTFHTLTKKDYVPGGQDWKPDDKITGFKVSAGNVKIPLNHEEFDTVREANVKVPKQGTDNFPVYLDVVMKPANGNASVEVVPENDQYAFGGQRVYVEWKRMEDTGKKPDKYLSDQPRICPAHWPRRSDYGQWQSIKYLIERFNNASDHQIKKILLDSPEDYGSPSIKNKINTGAVYPRQDDRALGSENGYSSRFTNDDRKVLENFIAKLKSKLNPLPESELDMQILKILGYTYSSGMDELLFNLMRKKGVDMEIHGLTACGMCLRDPVVIKKFAELLNTKLNDTIEGTANWTRAFAYILRFRELATKEISSDLCNNLTEHFYDIIYQEYENRNLKFAFRRSAMAMVLLLRRRIYDNNFLPPDSNIAEKTKKLFMMINKEKNIEILGGAINMRKEMKKYIDYIDREGSDDLLWFE